MNRISVITIDGPSGAGKGTVSRVLAQCLGWHLLDSGALYRLGALAMEEQGLAEDDEQGIADMLERLDFFFQEKDNETLIYLEGKCVNTALRTEQCGLKAAKIATFPKVRKALLECQRAFAQEPGLVADGRDMGTVVFPEAMLKCFLTASAEQRALRRLKQLQGLNNGQHSATLLSDIHRDIACRDTRDGVRALSPLKPAIDAYTIDCTALTVDAVVERILARVKALGISLTNYS